MSITGFGFQVQWSGVAVVVVRFAVHSGLAALLDTSLGEFSSEMLVVEDRQWLVNGRRDWSCFGMLLAGFVVCWCSILNRSGVDAPKSRREIIINQ